MRLNRGGRPEVHFIEEQMGSPQDMHTVYGMYSKLYNVHILSLDNKNVRRCINLQGLKGLTDKNRYG